MINYCFSTTPWRIWIPRINLLLIYSFFQKQVLVLLLNKSHTKSRFFGLNLEFSKTARLHSLRTFLNPFIFFFYIWFKEYFFILFDRFWGENLKFKIRQWNRFQRFFFPINEIRRQLCDARLPTSKDWHKSQIQNPYL